MELEQTKSDVIFEQLEQHFNELKENHVKGNKSSAQRARKAAGEFKKLVTEYRKESVSESK